MNEVAKKMLTKSKNSRLEKFGKTITFLCMSLIVVVVAMILIFVHFLPNSFIFLSHSLLNHG